MGDWFQSIVAKENQVEKPEIFASRIQNWLVQEKVIMAARTKCVLSRSGLGYQPGPKYERAIEKSQSKHDTRKLFNNGLDIITDRTVFDSGQGDVEILCPKCRTPCSGDWAEAIGNWYEHKGAGLIRCAYCGHNRSIIEWIFVPAWGFSNLGFTFWNWPRLNNSFIEEFSQRLDHQIIYIEGKL